MLRIRIGNSLDKEAFGMGNWKDCILADLGEIVGGATPSTKNESYYGGDIPWITPKDLSNFQGRFIRHGERNITIDGLNSCSAKLIPSHSVLFTSRAPIGYVAIAENEICTNQGFKSIVPNENTNFLFLYYLLVHNREKIENMGSGTTFKEVSGSVMKQILVTVPTDIEEQRTIARILGVLDDKIENNTKINHHLAQMAQEIFKSWFVDFEPWNGVMPEDWREGTLSEIANIIMGQSPDGVSYNEDGIGTVFYQGRAEFGSRFPTRRLFTTQPKRMAIKDDVLISVRAPVGDLNVAYEPCCLGRGLAGIQSNSGCQSFILYTMFALKQQLDMFNGEGTVFGSINRNDMANLSVLIPTEGIIHQFEAIVHPMDVSIESNYTENRNLEALRDTLLPRLMSGELSVFDIDDAK